MYGTDAYACLCHVTEKFTLKNVPVMAMIFTVAIASIFSLAQKHS